MLFEKCGKAEKGNLKKEKDRVAKPVLFYEATDFL